MCDDQLWFFLSPISFSSSRKLIPWPSPDSDKSQIFLLSWALILDLHRLNGCREEHRSCSRSNVVVKKNVWSGWRISQRTIHNYFLLSSWLTEVPKNRSHPRLIQEYLSHVFFSDDMRKSHWTVLYRQFLLSSHWLKVLAAILISTFRAGFARPMSSSWKLSEKVWLW